MFFWLREIAGWLLAALGVYLIWMGVGELQSYDVDPRMIEGSVLCATGVMVLRFGIHLIRVATAARIVLVPRGKVAAEKKTG
jgi:hypothetical protein